jgi:hypothetical protein
MGGAWIEMGIGEETRSLFPEMEQEAIPRRNGIQGAHQCNRDNMAPVCQIAVAPCGHRQSRS